MGKSLRGAWFKKLLLIGTLTVLTGCSPSLIRSLTGSLTGQAPARDIASTPTPVTFSNSFLTLNTFASQLPSGGNPAGDLLFSGGSLYGTASVGGTSNKGVIFKIAPDGTGQTVLHHFTGTDGNQPQSKLTLSGSTLYGVTSKGGSTDSGVIFKMQTDGTGFSLVHEFVSATDGGAPQRTELVLSAGKLYGTTYTGGAYAGGTIFSVNVDGTGFTVLRALSSGDGTWPQGGLVLSGSTLYGTTITGGANNYGTIFSINTDGTSFTVLQSIDSAWGYSNCTLIYSGTTLYGMTMGGGTPGTIFSIEMDGSGFNVLRTLVTADGTQGIGSLLLSGGTLYGISRSGGANGAGTIFSMAPDGSNYTVLHDLTASTDGSTSYGSLILSGSTLYGMTHDGGTGGAGTIFSIETDGSSFSSLYHFPRGTQAASPTTLGGGSLVVSGNAMYGTTTAGGTLNTGTIFKSNLDGSGLTTLYSFGSTGSDGSSPSGTLLVSGNTIYGVTPNGGTSNQGTIYRIDTDGSNYSVLHRFTSFTDGQTPYGGLVISGNTLYGTTYQGGSHGQGSIFSIATDGTGFTLLRMLNSADGRNCGALLLSGTTLYGLAASGGPNSAGALFSIQIGGSGFTILHAFTFWTPSSPLGYNPQSGLVLLGNTLYGVNFSGGLNHFGSIFSVGIDGSSYSDIYSFTTSGSITYNAPPMLVVYKNQLYGTTASGGVNSGGILFRLNPDGTDFTTLHSFSSAIDGSAATITLSGDVIYGSASNGSTGTGTLFKLY